MMNKRFRLLLISLSVLQILNAQTVTMPGKPIAEIFTDFHYNLNDTTKTTGFAVNRAYFGYNYLPAGKFSGTLVVTIGNPEELSDGSVHRRYAYFREASLTYTNNNLIVIFGITGTKIFNFQQTFWGKRYIAVSYQQQYGYGFVADLGVLADYKFSDKLRGDLSITNGDGYSELQLDNSVKASAGLTITPDNQIAIRLYGDINKPFGLWQYTLVAFTGFKNKLITIGVEASYKSNLNQIAGHNVWGLSGTAGVNLSEKVETFVRYDYSTSVYLPGEDFRWNNINDKTFTVFGVQYTFNQYVKMALDYQGTFPYNTGKQNTNAIFINGLFKF